MRVTHTHARTRFHTLKGLCNNLIYFFRFGVNYNIIIYYAVWKQSSVQVHRPKNTITKPLHIKTPNKIKNKLQINPRNETEISATVFP